MTLLQDVTMLVQETIEHMNPNDVLLDVDTGHQEVT